MGDGNWLNVGGNNAVTTGGLSLADLNLTEGTGAYDSLSGGRAVRWMKPCSDLNCESSLPHCSPPFFTASHEVEEC